MVPRYQVHPVPSIQLLALGKNIAMGLRRAATYADSQLVLRESQLHQSPALTIEYSMNCSAWLPVNCPFGSILNHDQ